MSGDSDIVYWLIDEYRMLERQLPNLRCEELTRVLHHMDAICAELKRRGVQRFVHPRVIPCACGECALLAKQAEFITKVAEFV